MEATLKEAERGCNSLGFLLGWDWERGSSLADFTWNDVMEEGGAGIAERNQEDPFELLFSACITGRISQFKWLLLLPGKIMKLAMAPLSIHCCELYIPSFFHGIKGKMRSTLILSFTFPFPTFWQDFVLNLGMKGNEIYITVPWAFRLPFWPWNEGRLRLTLPVAFPSSDPHITVSFTLLLYHRMRGNLIYNTLRFTLPLNLHHLQPFGFPFRELCIFIIMECGDHQNYVTWSPFFLLQFFFLLLPWSQGTNGIYLSLFSLNEQPKSDFPFPVSSTSP